MANFNEYIATLRSGLYKPLVKVELLREDESVERTLDADILGGSLSINRNNGARRTCSLTLKGTKELLPDVYGIWAKRKFKLYLGIEINDDEFFLPQGVFILTDPSYDSTPEGNIVTLNGTDKFALLNGEIGGTFKDVYKILQETSVEDAIKGLLVDFFDPKAPIIDILDEIFPYDILKNQGDNAGDLLKEIAYFCAKNIYYDENGHLVFTEDIADENKSSEWDFNNSLDNFTFLSCNVNSKMSEVKNIIKIIGTNVNSGEIVEYTAINDDPSSGTEVSRLGELPYVEINEYITTVAKAENLAKYILKRKKVMASNATINSIKMIHLDVDKVVTVSEPKLNFYNKRFLINQINIDLGIDGGMSATVVDTDEIDFTTGQVGEYIDG